MNVVVVGATGYSGLELIRLIIQHPKLNIYKLYASNQAYQSVLDIYPHLKGFIDIAIETIGEISDEQFIELRKNAEIVFLATPSGVSTGLGPIFLRHGFKVIDLSGDFRLKDPKIYKEWYQLESPSSDLLEQATYGLAEWFSEDIKKANYIANPGCYATSILLALAPLFNNHIPVKSIIIDAKSGVSGAGRGLSRGTNFSEVNDNFKVYKVGTHKHIPEVEQVISLLDGKSHTIQMMTHLVPMTRGILSSIYIDLDIEMTYDEIINLYQEAYGNQPFIRICDAGEYPETKHVYGTNFCDISIYLDQRTKRLIIFSVIDNLMKGAAGQAVQNLNIMMDWEQELGLTYIPCYP